MSSENRTTAKQKRYEQAMGVVYGCHVEIGVGEQPDKDCVKDYGNDKGCIYACNHRSREGCKYWQPINGGRRQMTAADLGLSA